MADRVVTPTEGCQLAAQGLDALDLAVTLFAAKEAVYKALFPLTRRFLEFADVRIDLTPSESTFAATVTPGADAGGQTLGHVFSGRYCRTAAFVAAAVEVPARPRSVAPAGGR